MATLEKVERLEKRKKLDTTVSTMGGVIGGIIIAMIGKWALIWKTFLREISYWPIMVIQ